MKREAEDYAYQGSMFDVTAAPPPVEYTPRTPRPHQIVAFNMVGQAMQAGKMRPMLQLPTGAGKTFVASCMVKRALAKGNPTMFIVPAISLIDQTVRAFWSEGITDIGVIQADHPMTNLAMPVQVASVQTLMARKHLPDSKFVIIDEAHRWFQWYSKFFADWNAIRMLGLSATPWTKGLGQNYDDLLIPVTLQELIDGGYLSPFKVFAPDRPDTSSLKVKAGEFDEKQSSAMMSDSKLVGNVVTNWVQNGEGRPTLCFGVDRAHARAMQEAFLRADIPCEYIDAYTPIEERSDIGRRLERGDIKVVCNVGCLTTGVDWDVRCIILARPTKSEMLYVQIIGRGLRLAPPGTPPKDYCLIFDHSSTTMNLGFVTDIHHDELDKGDYKGSKGGSVDEDDRPKHCPSCNALKPKGVHACPECGFAPKKRSMVEHEDGELSEITATGNTKWAKKATSEEKRAFYLELKGYAEEKGYKPGWASNQYKTRAGCWPSNMWQNMEPLYPSTSTRQYVRSALIRYAKGKAKARASA